MFSAELGGGSYSSGGGGGGSVVLECLGFGAMSSETGGVVVSISVGALVRDGGGTDRHCALMGLSGLALTVSSYILTLIGSKEHSSHCSSHVEMMYRTSQVLRAQKS